MKKFLSAAALLLSATLAQAQNVQQSGSVTAGHAVQWVGSGVVKDAGTAANGSLTSLGVTNNGGPGICVQSAIPTAAARNQLCLSVTTNGGAKLSSYSYGTATNAGFSFDVNGVLQGFPTVNLPVAAGNGTCFLNTSGTLTDCGFVPAPTSAIAPNVYPIVCDATGVTECAHFGTQLAACEAGGGGEVVFPHGYFLLNAGYTVAGACIVRGQGWQTFLGTGTTSNPGTIGTWLKQTSVGLANVMITISTGSNGFQLRDVAFWQVQPADTALWAPTAYQPVVINLSDGTKFQNILLFGTTQGIQLGRLTPSAIGSGNVNLSNIQGVCFTADGCINVVKAGDFISIDTTYFHSSIIGALNTNIIAYAKSNTAVIRMARADSPTITNHRSFENHYCLQFASNSEGYTSRAMISNMSCDHHEISLLVTGASTTAEVVNVHMTGQGTASRGIQCATSCILHVTNATVDNMNRMAFWAEAPDAQINVTNATVNNCNASNTFGDAPFVTGANAFGTINGGYTITGSFCTIATFSGAGALNSGYGRFQDTYFSLIDNSDNTKVGAFQLAGLTTGTTRAWTMPDGDFTFTGNALIQTLTNKTINAASGVNTFQLNGNTVNNYSGSGATVLLSANPEISGALRLEGSSSQVILLQASAVAGNGTLTLPATTDTLSAIGLAETFTGVKTFGSAGAVGRLKIAGTTSGALTLNVAAVAGSGVLTLPAGTTDFSGTGGTSQVVKQTSAGGAFTVAQLAASDLSNGTTGSGAVLLATTPTITTPTIAQINNTGGVTIQGTNTNNSASSGYVGEVVTNTTSGVSLTTGAPATITSVPLPAGDWDVWCQAEFIPAAGTTVAYQLASISEVNNVRDGTVGYSTIVPFGNMVINTFVASSGIQSGPVRKSYASTTTTYCVAQSGFAISTQTASAFMLARRKR